MKPTTDALLAIGHAAQLNKEELLMEAFKFFDKDESGYITIDELKQALKDTGADTEDAKAVLEAADANSDGEVDYEEFCEMMRNNDFENLVKAKTALKTHIYIDAEVASRFSEQGMEPPPEDHAFDDLYSTKSMFAMQLQRPVNASPEPVRESKVEAEIQPAD